MSTPIPDPAARTISLLLHIIHSNEQDMVNAQAERNKLRRSRSPRFPAEQDRDLSEKIKQCHVTARYAALKLLDTYKVHVCGYGLPNPHRPDGADGPPVAEITKGA